MDLALKNMLVALGSHLEDQLPEVVVFVVDVSDALYTTLCLRTVNSFPMVGLLVLVRAADTVLSLYSMHALALDSDAGQRKNARAGGDSQPADRFFGWYHAVFSAGYAGVVAVTCLAGLV
ncbi:unnamed protein product [Phytophthora lilii]|uniref:Unnamed protein product n=1 Tax=Phytophthora lilii TaxID=2077276 RepID=A0A9W6WQW7_9STRA|nr:unnamed protein product [Phytophthora lilii]